MSLVQALQKSGATEFSRDEVKAAAKANGIKTVELVEFFSAPQHKLRHGVYTVTPQTPVVAAKIETDEEIEARISDRFDILEKLTESAAVGDTRALIISGPPGLGKTHTVTKVVEQMCQDVTVKTISGSASAIGLYRALYETHAKGSVLIVDDCDTVFYDLAALSLIKAACDSTKKRVIRWCSDYHFGGDGIPQNFDYDGSLIFITNIDFDVQLAKVAKLTPHLEALMSRAHYLTLGIRSRRDYLVRIKQVITQMYLKQEFKKEEALDAINFVNDNVDTLRELSCRTAIKLIQLRSSLPDDWQRVARLTMCKN